MLSPVPDCKPIAAAAVAMNLANDIMISRGMDGFDRHRMSRGMDELDRQRMLHPPYRSMPSPMHGGDRNDCGSASGIYHSPTGDAVSLQDMQNLLLAGNLYPGGQSTNSIFDTRPGSTAWPGQGHELYSLTMTPSSPSSVYGGSGADHFASTAHTSGVRNSNLYRHPFSSASATDFRSSHQIPPGFPYYSDLYSAAGVGGSVSGPCPVLCPTVNPSGCSIYSGSRFDPRFQHDARVFNSNGINGFSNLDYQPGNTHCFVFDQLRTVTAYNRYSIIMKQNIKLTHLCFFRLCSEMEFILGLNSSLIIIQQLPIFAFF